MRAFDAISEHSDTENYTTWQVMQEYLPKELLTEYKNAFSLFDPKATGLIPLKDITKILKNMGWEVSLQEVKDILHDTVGSIFEKFSADYADFQEYIAIISVIATNCVPDDEMYRVFQHFDRDGDGFISPRELGALISSMGDEIDEKDTQEMMRAADIDGDGKVSYEEFVRVMTNSSDASVVISTDISGSRSDFTFDEELSDSYAVSISMQHDADCAGSCCSPDIPKKQIEGKQEIVPRRRLSLSRRCKIFLSDKKRKIAELEVGKILRVKSKGFRRIFKLKVPASRKNGY